MASVFRPLTWLIFGSTAATSWATVDAQAPDVVVSVQIGALDAPEDQVFGSIAAVEVLDDGRLVVLDSRLMRLRIYSATGHMLHQTGRPGGGPGEFMLPDAIAVVGQALFVLDRRAARIVEYAIGDTLEYRGSRPAPTYLHDICAIGSTLFGLGFEAGSVIHRLEATTSGWRARASFGGAGGEGLIGVGFSNGYLSCSDEPRMVVWTSRQAGTIAAYAASGNPLWAVTIPGFLQMRITPLANGRTRYEYPTDDRWHHMVAGIAASSSDILVTYGRSSPQTGSDDDPEDLHVLALDKASGAVRSMEASGGVVRRRARQGTWWLSTSRPYPRLLAVQRVQP